MLTIHLEFGLFNIGLFNVGLFIKFRISDQHAKETFNRVSVPEICVID